MHLAKYQFTLVKNHLIDIIVPLDFSVAVSVPVINIGNCYNGNIGVIVISYYVILR